MGQRRLTKKDMVDLVVELATRRFRGDKRDGETPPITVQNFFDEGTRFAAKALRARLSRLPLLELVTEGLAALDYEEARQKDLLRIGEEAERIEREEAAQALRQRQAELGRRHCLQPAILAAACHYRGREMNAGEAWDALNKTPFVTDDGATVEIEGKKQPRLKQRMRVKSPGGGQHKRSISFTQWRQAYWSRARKPG